MMSLSISSLLQKGWILSSLVLQKNIVTGQKLRVHIEKELKLLKKCFKKQSKII